jgi:hypothetical protein
MKAAAKRRDVSRLVSRGRSLFYQGDYVRAASVLEQAVQQDPTHPDAIAYLVASGVAVRNLQNHGWPQPGFSQVGGDQSGVMAGGEGGMAGMPSMPGMGGSGGPSGGMGMPGMPGGGMGMPPGMGGGSGGGMGGGRRSGEG